MAFGNLFFAFVSRVSLAWFLLAVNTCLTWLVFGHGPRKLITGFQLFELIAPKITMV
jgi:hypothetical protein